MKEAINFSDLEIEIDEYINYYNYDRPQWSMNKMTPYEHHQYLIEDNSESLLLPACIVIPKESHLKLMDL